MTAEWKRYPVEDDERKFGELDPPRGYYTSLSNLEINCPAANHVGELALVRQSGQLEYYVSVVNK